jgi:hypothetical protein
MTNQALPNQLNRRLDTIKTIVTDDRLKNTLTNAFTTSNGNWTTTLTELKNANVPDAEIKKIDFAHSLADITNDNTKLVTTIAALPHITSLRDLALNNDTNSLAKMVQPDMVPADVAGDTPEKKVANYASSLMSTIFAIEPSAVLQRMATNAELPIKDTTIRNGVATFFANQPQFNIRTTSIYNAIGNADAFKGIADDAKEGVISQLKTLQRVQALSPTPEAVNQLIEANVTTAFHISEMSPQSFVKAFSGKISEDEAKTIHANAINARIQYDHALVSMKEFVNGTAIAAIDDGKSPAMKMKLAQQKTLEKNIPVNWENLFGSADFCECGDCCSVYSPASYFVELLQYLRNNDLEPGKIKSNPKDITGTPLEKLFRRRPDLGCLELTCANTNTELPYIDLVNEVMESFVVHIGDYHGSTTVPKQATIDPWNVANETSGELLAEPQHTNYDAYCILKKAVYPFTLPYHQPIDQQRIFLKFLQTSRYELLKTFRSSGEDTESEVLPEETNMPVVSANGHAAEIAALNKIGVDRAIDAEFLNITQEEYIILTKQAFWDKHFFELKCNKTLTDQQYLDLIKVKQVYEYYGYSSEADMLSTDKSQKTSKGLTFVKDQFLKRTGLLYTDLVELLKTQFINPNYPSGKSLSILESIRFSYRYLQTLVNTSSTDPKVRFAKLVDFLEKTQPLMPLLDAMLHPDACHNAQANGCIEASSLKQWVYCHFEKVGKMIVLESGDQPYLPVQGKIVVLQDGRAAGSTPPVLQQDGTIVDVNENEIGHVTPDGWVVDLNNKPLFSTYAYITWNNEVVANITGESRLVDLKEQPVQWQPAKDTCNIDKVQLLHLDGTAVTVTEYDKIHRFIRLWRKLGWSIDETDKALIGLSAKKINTTVAQPAVAACGEYLDEYKDDCNCVSEEDDCHCDDSNGSMVTYDINPDFLQQLVSVKKLLDSTGLELIKLLTFWTDISTRGDNSLYNRLFLTHNLLAIDKVFKEDANGNYLTQKEKITDHIPVLMAAFNVKAEDIAAIMDCKQIPDELTLSNISTLYRYFLLMRVLFVKGYEMKEIVALFGDPMQSAKDSNRFLKVWGRMEDAGFTYRQLNYIIRGKDDDNKPLTPKKKTILQLAKTLYDGLNKIDTDNPDLDKIDDETIHLLTQSNPPLTQNETDSLLQSKATEDLIRSKLSLLFDQNTVTGIIALLQGTTVYSTNAPVNLVSSADEFTAKLTGTLAKKLKYDFANGGIQVTGILTTAEITNAKALFNPPEWAKAIDRAGKQPLYYFNDVLTGIFSSNPDEAKQVLLQGDINLTDAEQDPMNPVANTAPIKREYFLEKFLPFLREQLSHQFIVDNLSSAAGIEKKDTDTLISNILYGKDANGNIIKDPGGNPVHLIDIFKAIKNLPPDGTNGWTGYLIPSSDGVYTISVVSGPPRTANVKIDGQSLNFTQQADPDNLWLSDPIKLQNNKTYQFEVTGLTSDLKGLYWKTATSPQGPIPASNLLPDYSFDSVNRSFIILQKAGILVTNFNLNNDETNYLELHGADFDALDFNALTLKAWKRLESYARFRNSLPQTDTTILEFLNWNNTATDATQLTEKIARLTNWKQDDIDKLVATPHFNLKKNDDFRNEKNFLKLQKALYVADKTSADINLLFDWAKPTSKFKTCHTIAQNIEGCARARYTQDDWEQVVKPLNDELRENQKNALIAYLLVQQDLIDWGVQDANSLFEFFLIDVQMDACMTTSRIKQGISSIQLFVQRCFLGLESKLDTGGNETGVAADVLDRDRWSWMSRNVIWQANRKVFLYPENWIETDLRDDKSPFYKELESELLQKDINKQNVADALKNYLYKVDEVANMEVVGLYIDGSKTNNTWSPGARLHVFSRTRNAPYFYYYRYFDLYGATWTAWEKIQVDIPGYDAEDLVTKEIKSSGSFLTPVVWNNRLLIFFPQIMKKTKPNPSASTSGSFNDLGNKSTGVQESKPLEYFEVKMAWSEYKNGKWTQKQMSKDVALSDPLSTDSDNINYFKFIPVVEQNDVLILFDDNLDTVPDGGFKATFKFDGSQIRIDTTIATTDAIPITAWNMDNDKMFSWQIKNGLLENKDVSFTNSTDITQANNIKPYTTINFYHPYTKTLLGKLNSDKLNDLFSFDWSANSPTQSFGGYNQNGNPATGLVYNELKAPYSLYNWELCFHTVAAIADKCSNANQFEEAMNWYHYIFNPMAAGLEANRAWQFYPFQHSNADNFLEGFFNSLQPNQANDEINDWRNNPFNPHAVARNRTSAYMKWIVMKYIDNLIAWGDYLYRQDTIESINYATQLYITAWHILGPRPQMIPKRGKVKPQTYKSLLNKWDAFGNAMVEMELAFPFSNQITTPFANGNGTVGLANIFGFATSLYFCIPNNPNLLAYWDTIDDRLYKIRHCENIEGIFRKLALWDAPIDPGLLVQATAQGLSLDSVLNDLNSPMPNYRFNYLIQKALELCNELKSMGNSLLSVFEKKDAEALAKMRAGHETTMQNLMMKIKTMQLDEANKALDGLQQNRKTPVYRLQHYLKLIGEDLNKVPAEDADFSELANQIETPIDDSGLKLINYEKEDMDKANDAADWQVGIGVTETIAGILNVIPTIGVYATPVGVGGTGQWGGSNLGSAASAVARAMQTYSSHLSFQSGSAGKKGGFLRQLQDRILQANLAGYEVKQIDKQIASQQIRIQMAQQEIDNQQKQIDNATEVEEFLTNKYTNEDLYSWMEGSIKTLYHQVYTLAYDLAKKAEKAYQFERGLTDSNFIQFGYWDASRDGLQAGERLYVGIKQLEAAWQEKRGYDFEVTKHVSLRQINPLALLELREKGACEFELPEVLFDMDYPGHYMRRIKSVSLSIPCIAGPYTTINATLRLLENKFRKSAIAKDGRDYLEKTETSDDRFMTVNIPITAIAISSGQNDSGMFELNFKDERYMPFEGAGAASKWRLEFPADFRQFDYNTISDAIVHIRYTSVDGGDKLKKSASDALVNYIKSVEELSEREGLFAFFDLPHDFPNEWYNATGGLNGAAARILSLGNLTDRLPAYTKGRQPNSIKATDIIVATSAALQPAAIKLTQNGNDNDFSNGVDIGTLKAFAIHDELPMQQWQLKITDTQTALNDMWLVVRYELK